MTMSQTEWVELVAKWRASRQSTREFAIAHGVADSALRYWAGRLTRELDEPECAVDRPKARTRRSTTQDREPLP